MSADLASANRMPDRQIIRSVGDHRLREGAAQQHLVGDALQGVAADQAVSTQLPDIPELADGRGLRGQIGQIVGRVVCCRSWLPVQQQVRLPCREAGQLDIEVEVDQRLEMLPQQVEIPQRLFRQAVVGDNNGAFFRAAEARYRQRRDLGSPEPLRRFQAAMTG
jgi:hypothetical protein